MSERDDEVVSPADSRVIVGTQNEISALFVKEKFFSFEELLGHDKTQWNLAFMSGEFVICRLTPEKYHYNHTPVSGEVVDFYEVSGSYHSCNPTALVEMVTPISKNRRVVTIIDTDVEHGTKIGLVAMIEVVALMVGDIVQEYCEDRYQNPKPINKGLFLKKGVPKSLFRPGSSTLVLLFQRGQIYFMDDLIRNRFRPGVESRFSLGFGQALAETDLDVRSPIARKRPND
jgi:phosphatidylserine decarboxylase